MRFRNPANGYVEEAHSPWLWALLVAPIYFALRGAWAHAIIGLFTWPLCGLVYTFLAHGIVRTHYLRRGWEEL